MTAAGYDEAVEKGIPFSAEPVILARDSADPVPVTESEPFTEDEIVLQEPGRDLRPDTVTPSPEITSSGVVALENFEEAAAIELAGELTVADVDSPLEVTANYTSLPSPPLQNKSPTKYCNEGGHTKRGRQNVPHKSGLKRHGREVSKQVLPKKRGRGKTHGEGVEGRGPPRRRNTG